MQGLSHFVGPRPNEWTFGHSSASIHKIPQDPHSTEFKSPFYASSQYVREESFVTSQTDSNVEDLYEECVTFLGTSNSTYNFGCWIGLGNRFVQLSQCES